jgi:hypothetical protein
MTEAEWFAENADIYRMLRHIMLATRRDGCRKYCLLHLAFGKELIDAVYIPKESREVIEAFEKWLDNKLNLRALNRILMRSIQFQLPHCYYNTIVQRVNRAVWTIGAVTGPYYGCFINDAAFVYAQLMPIYQTYKTEAYIRKLTIKHRKLIRCIFGNLFCCPTSELKHELINYITPEIRKLAELTYTTKSFKHLPFLADCLEEQGCVNNKLLTHLRDKGPHVKGCWPLELILDYPEPA